MWGSDYPHDEGTYPYTRENLRARFHDVPEAELRQMLAGNAAAFYDFDLAAMDALAATVGPTVEEVAMPIEGIPDTKLERLSSDMDSRALK
ncbi:MAG: amidohydrolase family protein [Microthrixaceae bacterium]